jgi:hypothetical protein
MLLPRIVRVLACGLLAAGASAETGAKGLPPPVLAAQKLMVDQGDCEKTWPSLYEATDAPSPIELGQGVKLWLAPCAQWAYNLDFAAYVTIPESSRPEGYITKQLFFVNYSPFKKIYAENVVHNLRFDPATGVATARYFLDRHDFCGTRAQYRWDAGQQTFSLVELAAQDDCGHPDAPWVKIYP